MKQRTTNAIFMFVANNIGCSCGCLGYTINIYKLVRRTNNRLRLFSAQILFFFSLLFIENCNIILKGFHFGLVSIEHVRPYLILRTHLSLIDFNMVRLEIMTPKTFTFVNPKSQNRKQFVSIFFNFHFIPFLSVQLICLFVFQSKSWMHSTWHSVSITISISIFSRDLSIHLNHQLHLSTLYLRLIDNDLFIIINYLWIWIRCQNHFKKTWEEKASAPVSKQNSFNYLVFIAYIFIDCCLYVNLRSDKAVIRNSNHKFTIANIQIDSVCCEKNRTDQKYMQSNVCNMCKHCNQLLNLFIIYYFLVQSFDLLWFRHNFRTCVPSILVLKRNSQLNDWLTDWLTA